MDTVHEVENRRCTRSGRCAGRDANGKGALLTKPEGLCELCVSVIVRSIRSLENDLVELGRIIATGRPAYDDRVNGSRELPTPIHLGIDALRGEIIYEVLYWARGVAAACGSLGYSGSATEFLALRIEKLLALGPCERPSWTRDGEPESAPVVYTGLEGALRLDELHRRAYRVCGRTALVHRLIPACPWCDHRALVRHNGSSHVECENCSKIIDERHYSWFVRTLVQQGVSA